MEDIIECLRRGANGIANTTAHFMSLAEKYMADGNIEAAKACLILLCENCDNYEESIEFNELTEQWQKYRYLVEELVPQSLKFNSVSPHSPEECTMQIEDILLLPDDNILCALSEHLGELSGEGDSLSSLNKWELIVYYVDELCTEVNSGGFNGYLYYNGLHFENAYNALESINALGVLQILNTIREKFPKKRIPKNEESLQNTIDLMEEKGVDFETEDELFYSTGEKELIKYLLTYIKENKRYFR